jgi:putative tryptophan/tyrosine transport system substrate-binding protein
VWPTARAVGHWRIAAFRQRLAELGWREGENVHIEYRWSADQGQRIDRYAKELVGLSPDVIVANSTPAVTALKQITVSIPVVFAMTIDPVGLGHVQSLSHPGGNLTGFTYIDPELIGKWIDLLKAVAPSMTRAAILFNPTTMGTYSK